MRKLAEGQQAMILVKAGGLFQSSQRNGVSQNRLEFASMVQYYAPELVEEVFNGMTSLDQRLRDGPDQCSRWLKGWHLAGLMPL